MLPKPFRERLISTEFFVDNGSRAQYKPVYSNPVRVSGRVPGTEQSQAVSVRTAAFGLTKKKEHK